MRALEATRRLALRSLRGSPSGAACAGLWVASLVGIETVGRRSTSDLGDGLSVLAVVTLVLITAVWHRDSGITWVGALLRRFRHTIRRLVDRKAVFGVDFRRDRLEAFGYPRLTSLILVASGSLAVFAWIWPVAPMEGFRILMAPRFYVGFVVVLLVFWGLLLLSIGTSVLVFCVVVHDWLVSRAPEPRRRSLRMEVMVLGTAGALLVVSSALLPVRVALVALSALVIAVLVLCAVPRSRSVRMVWKSRATRGELRAISLPALSAIEAVHLLLGVTALVLLSLGNVVIGVSPTVSDVLPVTSVLARVLAFAATLGGGTYLLFVTGMLSFELRLDPERRPPTVVHVAGPESRAAKRRTQRLFRAAGLRTRFAPRTARREDVRVQVIEPDPGSPEGTTGGGFDRWPLVLDASELARPEVLAKIVRRDEVQKRRRLLKGLSRLFKIALRRRFRRGEGFWIGVHHWFLLGLSRDENEDEFDPYHDAVMRDHVGPAYDRFIDWPARQHLGEILRALDVDLIFLEDGVGFRRFERVLRVLFEIFDVHGGRQRAEERMLSGIPNVRVIIQEVGIDEPFRSAVYPEPDYEDIGRARVLHVFRDRGGESDLVLAPGDFDRVPVLR